MFKETGTSGHATHEQMTIEYEGLEDTGIIKTPPSLLEHKRITIVVRGV